ncbi:hypothetical protein MNEG_8547 [Monoraphidium neglectum]|uniref:Choice-of-anchor I domain-containing protein n=1 Tax=Monoraphidium neglectum TaxID=145388 RepID=A0A0D2JJB6_9CHLO|nr:hypothetical protein MNEG_8547 [Monoraphidium neglectum]KIY99412.1 hypothetical protein MNEG_8547 [Monoraphidium neglectum]|eukprot:XP_013898432.1 hypothetical protein MNEG_8547 [Monoraphidium neglectum]
MGATRITARGAAATVVFALLVAAAAAKCTEAPLGKTNFAAVLNSVSRINVTDPKRPTRPALLYQKACFLLSQTAPCDAAGSACCSSASEYLIKSLTIETDPACASKTNKTPFKTALWNLNSVGNSTKTRLVSSASHKAATKKLPPRFVVNLKSKTVISNSNNELCVDIPDVAANPTCKTIDKVCPGGKCKISITPAKIKSTKTQCCVSGEVPLNECGATGISCTPKAPCIRGTKLTAADVTCTKNGQPLPASAVSTLGTAVCAAGATNLTVVVASAAECASPVIVTFPEFVRPAVKLELIGQATIALAEQVVFDDANKLVYAIGGAKVNILSASALGTAGAPATLPLKGTIDFAVLDKPAGGTPEVTDIVICNGKLAVSVSYKTSTNAQLRGRAWFFAVGEAPLLLGFTTLGFLPDSLTWSADCGTLLASNEAEPNSYGQATSFDPEGSVSVVDTKFFDTASASPCNARVCTTVREAVFTQFNSQAAQLRAKGVRIYGPNATVAQDLEPEYSVFLPGTNFAAVGLQVR